MLCTAVLVAAFAILLSSLYFLPDPDVINNVRDLPHHLQLWHDRGKMMEIHRRNAFYIYERCSDTKRKDPPTFVLLHGYPSSSYEYHKVLDGLLEHGHVFVHDHMGFGFSDKPSDDFTYSIAEGAENALAIWRKLGLNRVHVVAHDMGDTILTEILARRHRGLLPVYFKDFFQSVTFSNGGMKYSLINFRLGQTLGSNVYLGAYFVKLADKLRINRIFANKQLVSIWGKSNDVRSRDADIESLVSLYRFRGGASHAHKHMYYLWDRAHFEFRWFEALDKLDIPCRFVWGNSDAVAPIDIPHFFMSRVPGADLSVVEGCGHFLMLEEPKMWLEEVVKILKTKQP